jgi:hypothetical protein
VAREILFVSVERVLSVSGRALCGAQSCAGRFGREARGISVE